MDSLPRKLPPWIGKVTHGQSDTVLYRRWGQMHARCSPNAKCRHIYSDRGIFVCEEWKKFEPFQEWALANGFDPRLELDRRNNDGPYCPENCRWITHAQNHDNSYRVKRVTGLGETKTVKEWSRDTRCVVKYSTLLYRLRVGWELEKALTSGLVAVGNPKPTGTTGKRWKIREINLAPLVTLPSWDGR